MKLRTMSQNCDNLFRNQEHFEIPLVIT